MQLVGNVLDGSCYARDTSWAKIDAGKVQDYLVEYGSTSPRPSVALAAHDARVLEVIKAECKKRHIGIEADILAIIKSVESLEKLLDKGISRTPITRKGRANA